MTRRLAGQANAQLSVWPMPVGIGVVAPRHEVAARPPGAAEDPAAARGAAVVAQLGEAGELLARLARDLGRILRIGEVLERLAGVLARELLGVRDCAAARTAR